jgi:hypothetical protein
VEIPRASSPTALTCTHGLDFFTIAQVEHFDLAAIVAFVLSCQAIEVRQNELDVVLSPFCAKAPTDRSPRWRTSIPSFAMTLCRDWCCLQFHDIQVPASESWEVQSQTEFRVNCEASWCPRKVLQRKTTGCCLFWIAKLCHSETIKQSRWLHVGLKVQMDRFNHI